MAISCAPADLAAAAKCFQCLSSEQKQWIDTYLLAVIAGGSTDPNTLALAAKCFQCIPPGMLRRIQAYLLCQVASGGGGTCPQDMQVAWTPTNAKLGEAMGFTTFTDLGVTSITFNQATSLGGFDIENTNTLVSLLFPNLATIDPTNTEGGYMWLTGNSALASLSTPHLVSVQGNLNLSNNVSLSAISLPALTTLSGFFQWHGCTLLTSISAPLLATVAGTFDGSSNPALTTVNISSFIPANNQGINMVGCALNAASVNLFLARCIANPTWGNAAETIDLSGGTSAAPTGAGIANKAALILRGATVTTN